MEQLKSIYLPQFTIGEDAFDHFQCEMVKYGKKLFVIHGERAWKAARDYVVPAIEKAGLAMLGELLYGHDATHENVKKICEDPRAKEADMLLAVGGGKCLDTVKLAADHLGKPVFTVPTIASNCAPITKISIMYHEDGSFCDIPRLHHVPAHCFIDPRIILAAPIKARSVLKVCTSWWYFCHFGSRQAIPAAYSTSWRRISQPAAFSATRSRGAVSPVITMVRSSVTNL